MLSRINRFHGHGSVRRAYRVGRPVRGALMSMHVVQDDRIKHSKVAVVVSKKIHKSAVVRNRIRRRIYENIRPRLATMRHPSELIITVYQVELAVIPAAELDQAVNDLFYKAHIS